MLNFFVAKSYENLPKLSEPFEQNGKYYITIKLKSGLSKNVRAYTLKERCPSAIKNGLKSQKEALGFGSQNFIWVFEGDNEDWFSSSSCRYCVPFGWYLPSDLEVPQLPKGISVRKLYADGLFDDKGELIK